MDSKAREKLILASASPRRSELLRKAGIDFQVLPSSAPEPEWDGSCSPEQYVISLAVLKASQVSARNPGRLVLGADTTVALDDRLFGKPGDMVEAAQMLESLSGRTHKVLTGVCLCRDGSPLRSWCAVSKVTFRKLDAAAIEQYFALVNPLDKAGAYGLQCHGDLLCSGFEGLHSTVVGLPVEEVVEALASLESV